RPSRLLPSGSLIPGPTRSPPFPYTTLFRSARTDPGAHPSPFRIRSRPMAHPSSAGARFRAALTAEKPLQIVGAVNAYTAMLARRSEEHTSELQSRENLVCRLLLEKKKNAPS